MEGEDEVPQEYENFLHALFSVNNVLLIGAGIFWHFRRNHKPLTARNPILMYTVLLGCLMQNILLWTLPYRRGPYSLAGVFFQWFSLALARDPYVWRVFQLFFLYKLTDKYIKREIVQDKETDAEDDDWYSRHRHWVSQEALTKSFLIFHCGFCVLLGIIAVLIMHFAGQVVYPIHGGLQFLYVAIAICLVVVIRKVQDAFYLKREFLAIAASWATESTITFIFQGLRYPSRYSLFTVFLEPIFAVVISFVVPIFMSYNTDFTSTTRSDTSLKLSQDEESHPSVAPAEYRTLDGIISNPVLADAFVNEVKKFFEVQMVFFLQQLQTWKASEPEQLAGKAFLLYQKFIKPGSLLDMGIPLELRKDIEEVLLDEEKLLNDTLSVDFFAKIEEYARDKLNDPLKYFKHSPEYAKALTAVLEGDRLNTGFKQVGIA